MNRSVNRLMRVAYSVAMAALEKAHHHDEIIAESPLACDALILAGLAGELRLLDALVSPPAGEPARPDLAAMHAALKTHVTQEVHAMLDRLAPSMERRLVS